MCSFNFISDIITCYVIFLGDIIQYGVKVTINTPYNFKDQLITAFEHVKDLERKEKKKAKPFQQVFQWYFQHVFQWYFKCYFICTLTVITSRISH